MDAGVGFYERVKDDATLKTVLGTKASGYARVRGGWPEDFAAESAFPQVTFLIAADDVIRPGVREFRLQVDMWAWVEGANGGPAKLEAIDDRLLALISEQEWTQGGVRWQGLALAATDRPAAPGEPLRRRRDFNLLGSTL